MSYHYNVNYHMLPVVVREGELIKYTWDRAEESYPEEDMFPYTNHSKGLLDRSRRLNIKYLAESVILIAQDKGFLTVSRDNSRVHIEEDYIQRTDCSNRMHKKTLSRQMSKKVLL